MTESNDNTTPPTDDHIVGAFLERFWKDRDVAGHEADLLTYLKAFPDHQDIIAREYAALRRRDSDSPEDFGSQSEPSDLGPYRIIDEIGRGGQGVVYGQLPFGLGPNKAADWSSGLRAKGRIFQMPGSGKEIP